MNTEIVFTPAQLWSILVGFATGLGAIAAAVAIFGKAWAKFRQPDKRKDSRIKALELQMETFNKYLQKDKTRLDELDNGNRVTQQALLALLGHAINGNNTDQLRAAKENLQNYLINK